jgi:glucose-6-phosphate isomerase
MPDIRASLSKMRHFSDLVRDKQWRGSTGKPIRDIVNIGIGGSHLGPLMTIHVDPAHMQAVLAKIELDTTLFIVSSKSFSTLETITNATTIREKLQNALGKDAIKQHMVAVTAKAAEAIQFGIHENNIFPLWDWVGGRYSIWSAIGLPLVIMIGMDAFLDFLAGAHEMDNHFRHTPFASTTLFSRTFTTARHGK